MFRQYWNPLPVLLHSTQSLAEEKVGLKEGQYVKKHKDRMSALAEKERVKEEIRLQEEKKKLKSGGGTLTRVNKGGKL